MTQHQSHDYYHRRAEEERRAAEAASNERVARPHRQMSSEYEKLASGEHRPQRDADMVKSGTVLKGFQILP